VTQGRRRFARAGLIALGIVLVIVVVVAAAFPFWWGHRSATSSQELLRRAGVRVSAAPRATGTLSKCLTAAPTVPGDPTASGVLQIPSLNLTAPVVNGLADSVLAIAVGHDPSTPWPGAVGESVLEAHDVSFFSHINQLTAGQLVTWEAGCSESTFRVTSATVMHPGETIPTPSAGTGIALVTCWPTDALWWTSQRYVVTAALVTTTLVDDPAQWPEPSHDALSVPAAPGLAAGGLGLTNNPVTLGALDLSGIPSPAWASSPAPLEVANSALEEYVAARRSVLAQNPAWWASIAIPGVTLPSSWAEPGALSVTIAVTGSTVSTVTLDSGSSSLELSVSGTHLVVAHVAGF
jgi:LPXTG-site transpeptidase (sortase) family protein